MLPFFSAFSAPLRAMLRLQAGPAKRAALFFLLVALPSFAAENTSPPDDASITEVTAVCQEFDPKIPWLKKQPQVRQSLAVVVEGGLFLTVEDAARNGNLIEIRRAGSGARLESDKIEADDQIGAALLKVKDNKQAARFQATPLADKVRRNDPVTIVKMDESGQFQSDAGRVIEISASPRGLVFTVLTDFTVEKDGTPVFLGEPLPGEDRLLAGITTGYDKKTQTCTVLSAMTLKKFIAGARATPYPGTAWAGLEWKPLLDPVKREYLGVAEEKNGIMVVRAVPGSGAAAVLHAEDVIIEMDGFKLDEMGYYDDPDFGRLLFANIINGRHAPGDNIPLTIIRNREKTTVRLPLQNKDDRFLTIPENTTGGRAEYLAEGGLILRELTGDYLCAGGAEWIIQTNPRLVYYYFNPWQFSARAGEHVVILSRVLPDRINIGYHEYRDEVVTAVNNRPVRCLADVFNAVDRDGGLRRVSLMGHGVDLALDETELPEANKRIAANYRIPSLRYQRPEK
jgi:hypothetical protein